MAVFRDWYNNTRSNFCILRKSKKNWQFYLKVFKRKIKNGYRKIFKRKKPSAPNDQSDFISEKPLDGSVILAGTIYKKEWTIRNTGNIPWKGRYMKCVQYAGNSFYPESEIIKMPTIFPGEKYTLKVRYYAPEVGDYRSRWKMYNSNGDLAFPDKEIGLGVNIHVTTDSHLAKK